MSPSPQEKSWVTVEETEEAYETSEELTEEDQGKTQGHVAWQEQLRLSIRRLTRMEPPGNRLPKVGTHCLVIVGNMTQDVGKMAQVTKVTAKMVEIKFRGSRNKQLEHKLKRPNSLIMLETGLTMVQDVHGTVWICAHT
jgi:hypothetical protein